MEPHSTPALSDPNLRNHDLRRTPVLRTDVLVIGGGIAGATAALAAAESGASVLSPLEEPNSTETNTNYAQGGFAAVRSSEDSFSLHLDDTLRVGAGLTRTPKVAQTHHRVRPRGRRLATGTQCSLRHRRRNGELKLSREGGHSVGRVVHANGDATGREMQRVLTSGLLDHSSGST